jgi:alkanesulfonate monooxygenase SsuD/methylene tetrahydromethanopterin reductase-like flavin-dependent oxidoreductase (luciferase family)
VNRRARRGILIGLAVLVLLAPFAFHFAQRMPSGPAWGEWGPEEIEARERYVPEGIERLSGLWKAPLPDYDLARPEQSSRSEIGEPRPGQESSNAEDAGRRSAMYFLSGLSGALLTAGIAWLLTRRFAGKR